MDRYSKKILASLRKREEYSLLYEDAEELFPDTADFYNAVQFLKAHGLVKYIKTQGGVHIGVRLTHYGVNKKELDRREFWYLFFTRYLLGFISGIAVSVLSGLATAYILRALGI